MTVWCFVHGAAVVRVHDVASSRRACDLLGVLERTTPDGLVAEGPDGLVTEGRAA